MAEEVIGSGFSQSVKSQLKAREDVVSSHLKDNKQLLFLNANSAWVRLSSSVNTLLESEIMSLNIFGNVKVVRGVNTLADNNVLSNGISANGGGLKGGINTKKGFNPISKNRDKGVYEAGDINTSTYNNYNTIGFRPEPGITGVNIKSKNEFGTIREAEVSINVWTLEDLELIQALYLRPGYSMLLEWGHTQWIDHENSNDVRSSISVFEEFTKKSLSQDKIYKRISELKEKAGNNYDAMFGYVSNFSWDFRSDGGYDCTVKLISRGAILESMKPNFEPSGRLPNTEFRTKAGKKSGDSDQEKGVVERRSVYHKFTQELSKVGKYVDDNHRPYRKQKLDNKYATDFYNKLRTFTGYNFNLGEEGTGLIWGFFKDAVVSMTVPLYTVLDIFNNFTAPIDTSKCGNPDKEILRFYTGQTDKSETGPYEKLNKYVTSDYHFSTNPLICMIPKVPSIFKYKGESYELGKVVRTHYMDHKQVEKGIASKEVKGGTDDILNLHVGLYTILNELDKFEENSEPGGQGFLQVIKTLLNEMNNVLGGVNEFDVHYAEDENMYYIVDRKLTPTKSEELSEINLTGLKSTISNLNMSSKISPDIASMVSIAAQGSSGNYKDGVEALLNWNGGLIDRHIPKKEVVKSCETKKESTEGSEEPESDRLEEFLKNVEEAFSDFNTDTYDIQMLNDLRAYHKEFCNKYVTERYFKNSSKPKPVPGLIPVELSFDTIGIGGLKIGQAFKITPGILPSKYVDNFGFLITGLSHSLEGNKWKTTIKTQFFALKKFEN